MAQERTLTLVTAEISAGSFLDHNEKIPFNHIDILKLKVTPSVLGGTSQIQIYETDTFSIPNLVYGSNPFTGTEFDPVQIDNVGVVSEAVKGFIVPYIDKDKSRELHIKLVNNDAQAKMFTVAITYRLPNVFGLDPIVEKLSVKDVNARNNTLRAADINGGITVHTSTGGTGTVTTDTAANIIKICSLNNDGEAIKVYYINDGNQTLTFAGGVGVTIADTGQTIGSNESAILLFRRASSSTVVVYTVGA